MTTVQALSRAVPALLGAVVASVLVRPASAQDAEGLSARFREAVRAVQPAVVSVERMVTLPPPPVPPTRIRVPGVDIVVPGLMGPPGAPPPRVGRPTGSGIVIDAEKGLILTAGPVVEGGEGLTVRLPDGEERPVVSVAHDLASDPTSDLAVLTIAPGGLTEAKWGDSDALDLGDWVLTVGSPFGPWGSVSAGIVSGRRQVVAARRTKDLIQTDANVYPESSGGPLVNLKGEVVGIVVAAQGERERERGPRPGPGYAISAARAKRVAGDLATVGHVRRAYLGVRLSDSVGTDRPGVLISEVGAGTPAAKAGLMAGDVLQKVGERVVSTVGDVQAAVEFAEIGKPLSVTVSRGDEILTLEVVPAEQSVRTVAPEPDFIQPGELDLPQYQPHQVHPRR